MKKTLTKIKDGALVGLGILLVLGIANAWTNLGTVNAGDSLTATIWNDLVAKINDIGARTDGIYNSSGNVGIGTNTPTEKLEVNGNVKATSIIFSDSTEQTTAKNYIAGTIGTNTSINVPHNTKVYTNNYITLTPGKWQIVMAGSVHGNNFGSGSNWNSYHTHFDLSTSSSSYIPYGDGHSYRFEASPYGTGPVNYIADISSTTTLYWYIWFNGAQGVGSDSLTYYYSAPNQVEKPYMYAIRLQ